MMTMTYDQTYAAQYDQLYADKDYGRECDLIQRAFENYGDGNMRTLVDFGCGTGNHSLLLASRGYRVTGVDLSANMVQEAQRKASKQKINISWVVGDLRTVRVEGRPLDACLLMFAVLGYLTANHDVLAALRNARRHLRRGGLLLFDVWYGPAVLTIKPSDRAKIIPLADGKVIRLANATLDPRHHVCEVRYHLWRLMGDRVASEDEEVHLVRYFFPLELELMLSQADFELLSLTDFPTLDRPADETTWNVFVVARAV